MNTRSPISDPVERVVAAALDGRNIKYTHERDGVWPAN